MDLITDKNEELSSCRKAVNDLIRKARQRHEEIELLRAKLIRVEQERVRLGSTIKCNRVKMISGE